MSMIASDNGGSNIEKLEGGVYTGISSAIIDLGLQTSEKFGKTQRKFIMVWDIPSEEIEIKGQRQARQMSKEYSFSLNEKRTLRIDLQAWRGKNFTEEEARGFNLLNLLNKGCQLQIILEKKNDKSYNNIAGIVSLPKGVEVETLQNTYHFDLENVETYKNWSRIPEWIQDRIKKADNYESSGLKEYIEQYKDIQAYTQSDDLASQDDLPF